ncbi:MAG TPA: hypothetical protein VKX46_13230 [Ktedonobacteraceae bacterium]|nr:hypothetical protein [Ktedonobacteraceae bacterium]
MDTRRVSILNQIQDLYAQSDSIFCGSNPARKSNYSAGVPGDAVPWPGARGCPPTLSPPFAARRRRAASP